MDINKTEEEIIILLSNDLSCGEIAEVLNLSRSSIEKYISRMKNRNDIKTTTGLVGEYLNIKNYG